MGNPAWTVVQKRSFELYLYIDFPPAELTVIVGLLNAHVDPRDLNNKLTNKWKRAVKIPL